MQDRDTATQAADVWEPNLPALGQMHSQACACHEARRCSAAQLRLASQSGFCLLVKHRAQDYTSTTNRRADVRDHDSSLLRRQLSMFLMLQGTIGFLRANGVVAAAAAAAAVPVCIPVARPWSPVMFAMNKIGGWAGSCCILLALAAGCHILGQRGRQSIMPSSWLAGCCHQLFSCR